MRRHPASYLMIRKVLYISLTLLACVVWVPLAFAGMALLVGLVGLLSIGALLRAIVALPITDDSARKYYSVAIGVGIALMVGFIAVVAWVPGLHTFLLPVMSGMLLIAVGVAVLREIHVRHQ